MLSSSSPNDFGRETTALMAGPPKGLPAARHLAVLVPPSRCARAGAKRFDEIVVDAGFEVDVILNQGSGAAMVHIEARGASFRAAGSTRKPQKPVVRRFGYYHERKDEARNIGLGPEHDRSSHGCDAFGLMAVVYEEPPMKTRPRRNERLIGTHWSA
jgi:hypothetical protein